MSSSQRRSETLKAYAQLGFGPLPPKSKWEDGRIVQAGTALGQHSSLGQVMQMAAQSRECLRLIQGLLPPGAKDQLQAGPLLQGEWCVLVPHPAWAAKLRQQLPAWAAHLRTKGMPVQTIRLRTQVQTRNR
jgi:hypothetical protein